MKKIIILFAVCLLPLPVLAEGEPDTDGCGLGWQVTKKKTMSGTTTRATTNAFVPPTFGMTTGTIGCSRHPFVKKDEAAARYAMVNFDALTVEMAQGAGENLQAFARTLGCTDAGMEAFAKMAQENYSSLIGADTTAVDLIQNVRQEMESNPAVALTCGNSV